MIKKRLDVSLSLEAHNRLIMFVKEAKRNGCKRATKSLIIEEMIIKTDPLTNAIEKTKYYNAKFHHWKDIKEKLEEEKKI